ncbi:putative Olfactory receptor KSOR24 protein, partial [Naja naja]
IPCRCAIYLGHNINMENQTTVLYFLLLEFSKNRNLQLLHIFLFFILYLAVLRIPSVKGRQKTFSTCLPHLIVLSIFLIPVCLAYLRPPSNTPTYLDFILTALYSLLPPLFNPIIYSIRNNNIKSVLSNPMSFFLVNLAVRDLGIVSVIVPKSMINSIIADTSLCIFASFGTSFDL